MTDVLVLGSGLIGTSVGLALRQAAGYVVLLHDRDATTLDRAMERGAGAAWDGRQRVDLVVSAVPPAATAASLQNAQRLGLAQTYTHVCSVQSQVQREVEALGCDLASLVGGHPLAGKESSGPVAASADLFVGRPWALCPSAQSTPAALTAVRELALACGAVPLVVGALEHDKAVALLSHLPQVVSSALAALLVHDHDAPPQGPSSADGARTELSGAGLVDTTRLAAGDAALWTQILTANAAQVAPAVRSLLALLQPLADDLEVLAGPAPGEARARALEGVSGMLVRGNRGRAVVPVKRGSRDAAFAEVAVEVDDRPGRLAALLMAAGDAGVNVEDVHVDHVPGRPRGVIELLVEAPHADALRVALRAGGWAVQGSS